MLLWLVVVYLAARLSPSVFLNIIQSLTFHLSERNFKALRSAI
jgi:hypothetical protein